MSVFLKICIGLICFYFFLTLCVFFFQRKLMYHPSLHVNTPHNDKSPKLEKIEITTKDGLKLDSFYKAPKESKDGTLYPTILYFHGNTGPAGDAAHKLIPMADAGYGILLLEYRGFGDNAGAPTENGLILDALAGVSFVKEQQGEKARLIYYGMSMGTGVANGLAEKAPPSALIQECGFTSMTEAAQKHYPIFPIALLIKDTFNSAKRIQTLEAPLLVIHGQEDKTVPVEHAQIIFDSAKSQDKTLKIYPEAGHVNLFDWNSSEEILDWLNKRFIKEEK